jgi:hypothetical protein
MRCPKCRSPDARAVRGLSPGERCLDCGTLFRSDRPTAFSMEFPVRPGVSPFHVVLAALRELQDNHGAVVEDVDVGPHGGSFVLKVPIPDDDSDPADRHDSHPADADK